MTIGAQGANFIINITSTVILARLLSPQDYGILAMVLAITSFVSLFGDLGLSAAAIQRKDLGQRQQSNLFWLNVAMGSLLTVAVASASPLVAWFYKKPEVFWVTMVVSANFLITSLGVQSGAMLVRQMRFGDKALSSIVGAFVSTVVSITLALYGFSYWSLVWGGFSGTICTTLFLFLRSPLRPSLPTRGTGIREMLKFGAHVTAFDFINYFHRNLDNILIGKVWGADALGFYSRAYSLLMFPINNLRGPLNTVGFPVLSRLQGMPDAYRSYFCQLVNILAVTSMPLTAFFFIGARPMIHLILGSQWDGIVPVFSILATVAFVQPVITLWGMVCLSRGMVRRYLHLGIFNTLCSAAGYFCGLPWGAPGVATGYAVVTYLTAYPILAWTFRGTPLCFKDFLNAVIRPLVASLVAGCCAYLSLAFLLYSPLLSLFLAGLVFAVVYLGVFMLLPGGRRELGYLVSGLRFVMNCFFRKSSTIIL